MELKFRRIGITRIGIVFLFTADVLSLAQRYLSEYLPFDENAPYA